MINSAGELCDINGNLLADPTKPPVPVIQQKSWAPVIVALIACASTHRVLTQVLSWLSQVRVIDKH